LQTAITTRGCKPSNYALLAWKEILGKKVENNDTGKEDAGTEHNPHAWTVTTNIGSKGTLVVIFYTISDEKYQKTVSMSVSQ
jgi:hypothetical protein